MYFSQPITKVLKELSTGEAGLSGAEVKKRQEKFGFNALDSKGEQVKKIVVFLNQCKNPLIIILILAGFITGFLGEFLDTAIILGTAIINIVIGFLQEYKANKALSKLQSMVTFSAVVLRDGAKQQIGSQEIVVGDILFVSAGDKIQADCRLIDAIELEVSEAALTGESRPVLKKVEALNEGTSMSDRLNMIYRGTAVVGGEARAVVTAIGKNTEIGKIATLVKETEDEQTPLQKQLSVLAKNISFVVVLFALVIIVAGTVFSDNYTGLEMFQTAVAVAVAAIPEGLVISLTIILAIGMQRILKQKALVRKLVAVETLGSVSVICTDKTGTLTEGNMKVTNIFTSNDDLDLDEIRLLDVDKAKHEEALELLRSSILCSNATHQNPEDLEKDWKFYGDTTETALLYAGAVAGIDKISLDKVVGRVAELPFSSSRKYMATLNKVEGHSYINIKGAPEFVLKQVQYQKIGGKEIKLSHDEIKNLESKASDLAKKGLRVMAVGYKSLASNIDKLGVEDINNIVFLGFVGLSDPVRKDVKQTLKIAKKAGIHVAMITGDHADTAKAIAGQLGILSKNSSVLDGLAIDSMTDKELGLAVRDTAIFARVEPKHKIRIVKAFQANGEVVAMTGDGVNDAPAIKGADIGVALGSGTDVAKETSDMVLLDDSFATIVYAVEGGRTVYQNIKKVALYLIAGSFGEVVMITGSIIGGFPVAALPAQILWVNIVQDLFPAITLAFEGGDKGNMDDKPRKRNESIIDKEMKIMIILKSILANIALFSIFVYFWKVTGDIKLTRTIVFVGFGTDALFFIFSVRSLRNMIWQINPFRNKYLLGSVAFGWVMLLSAVYWHPLQILLRTVPLKLEHWILILIYGLFNVFLIESVKYVFLLKKKVYV